MITVAKTIPDLEPTKRCAAAHITPWMVEKDWFIKAVKAYQSDQLPIQAARGTEEPRVLFTVDDAGVAMIDISGHLMKSDSKFGGTSTIRTRSAVRMAAADPEVKAILLRIDSPGGTVAGTEELARDIRNAGASKPVIAHIDDLGASAALWIASQAGRVTANETAQVGSIGTVAVLEDSSEMAKKEGIKVHVISTGKFKGAGVPGTKVTDEHLAEIQEVVDDLNEHFLAAISAGRQIPMEAVREMADGSIHLADRALGMGLIDAVQPFDVTIEQIRADIVSRESAKQAERDRTRRRVMG